MNLEYLMINPRFDFSFLGCPTFVPMLEFLISFDEVKVPNNLETFGVFHRFPAHSWRHEHTCRDP